MSHFVECVCVDDEVVFVDKRIFAQGQFIIARMLGLVEGFADPETDEFGRLLFLKKFNISRDEFVQCQAFLSSGHVSNLNVLIRTFGIFGGCEELDAYIKQQKEVEQFEQTKIINNPIHPRENCLDLFTFEIHPENWEHGPEWSVTMKVGHLMWWRKRKK